MSSQEDARMSESIPGGRERGNVLAQLAAKDMARRAEADKQIGKAEDVSDPEESAARFYSSFTVQREKLQVDLDKIASSQDLGDDEMRGFLESKSEEIKALDDTVTAAAFYLPPYDLKSAQASVAALKKQVEDTKLERLPKKKFSFKTKKPPTIVGRKSRQELQSNTPVDAKLDSLSPFIPSGPEIKDREHVTVELSRDELAQADCTLSNITNCKIYLNGPMRALFIHGVRDSEIYAGAVQGAVHVEDVNRSLLVLAAHQVRIHSSKDTGFCLRLRSRPIIENSSAIRFGPFIQHNGASQQDLESAQLAEETGLWKSVDDFTWLRGGQSPNWSLLPEEEQAKIAIRVSSVNGGQ